MIRVLLWLLLLTGVANAQCAGGISNCPPATIVNSSDWTVISQPGGTGPSGYVTRKASIDQLIATTLFYNNLAVNWQSTMAVDGATYNANSFPKSSYFFDNTAGVYSSFTGAVNVPSTSTLIQAAGVSGYAMCSGTVTICLGSYSQGVANGDMGPNNGIWAANDLVSNSRSTLSGPGYNVNMVGREIDCNIFAVAGGGGPVGQVNCLYISGTVFQVPTGSYNAILVAPNGSSKPFKSILTMGDGSASSAAIFIGQLLKGNVATPSMPVFMISNNGSGFIEEQFFVNANGNFEFSSVVEAVGFWTTQNTVGGVGLGEIKGAQVTVAPTTGDAFLSFEAAQTGKLAKMVMFDAGVHKWDIGKETDNTFAIRDSANAIALQIDLGDVLHVNGPGINAPNLPISAGAVNGSLCIDTAGAIYVKTTTGPCK